MELTHNTIPLIYTTTRQKKVNVYFEKNCNAWIIPSDLKILFDTNEEQIEEIILANLEKRYIGITSISTFKYLNFVYVVEIGKQINRTETEELIKWHKIMTREYSLCTSDEFNRNLSKILDN
jgi:hypothetical protein